MAAELSAELRKDLNKRATKALRQRLMVPAVLYGRERQPVAVAVSEKELTNIVRAHGHSSLCTLSLQINGGEPSKQLAIYHELRINPLTRRVEHVDFQAVRADEKVHLKVPLHAKGVPVGVDLHAGVLIMSVSEVDIRCLPDRIPDFVEIDVSKLDLHQTLHLSDVLLGEGVELADDPKKVAASCRTALQKLAETPVVDAAAVEAAAVAAVPGDKAAPGAAAKAPAGGKAPAGAAPKAAEAGKPAAGAKAGKK